MSTLQWVLLVIGVVAVVAIYVLSRKSGTSGGRKSRQMPNDDIGALLKAQAEKSDDSDQMDMFGRLGEFDEFGVGRPRKRVSPQMDGADEADPQDERIVTLMVVQHEGKPIQGDRVHAALRSQSLEFGEHRIYHRMDGGIVVFSIASLVKPGLLDPDEAHRFQSPGLTLFMRLPGPQRPEKAVADMLQTAHGLARQLGADVYSDQRKKLTADAERALVAEVDAWAQQHG